MAAKRIAKSMVDWAAFAERVPPSQAEYFRGFKARSDIYVAKVHKNPENLSNIDFALYKKKLPNAALVEAFEKAYKAVTVAYPKDTKNLKSQVDAEEKVAMLESKKFVEETQAKIKASQEMLNKIDSVPNFDHMTLDMMAYYFPDVVPNPTERPTFWPHTKKDQVQYDPHTY